jgi:hypothetical protein
MFDSDKLDMSHLLSSGQVTDSYLLALACAHGGQLATFDRRLVTDAVRGGMKGLHFIEPSRTQVQKFIILNSSVGQVRVCVFPIISDSRSSFIGGNQCFFTIVCISEIYLLPC